MSRKKIATTTAAAAVAVAAAVRPAVGPRWQFSLAMSSAMVANNVPVEVGSIVRVPINQVLIMWIKMLDRGCC